MNARHNELYEYLLAKGDEWTSQVDVARDLYREFGNAECCLMPEKYHDTQERKILSKTIAEINESAEFEKIVVSSCKGIKIANEIEFDRIIKSQYSATIRKLARIYKMAKKGNRDKQIDFGGHTVEAFLEGIE